MFSPYARSIVTSASASRLQQLIEERTHAGTDKAALDKRIWDLFGEEWAVMFTDLSGFSRRVAQFGIIHFLQTIHESMRILTPVLENHDGVLLKVEADSMLVIFRHPERALACSLAMQQACKQYNVGRAAEEHILLCIGLGWGQMLRVGDTDVFGPEVNAASKLGEDTARAGEILVTDRFRGALPASVRNDLVRLAEAPAGADAAWQLTYKLA
ncbi:MAG: adenylate/guanylate cyclase domain-containing protein [Planctomycetes bacterium]|nr:adenylate/guanylate cyclase domain-containing protein [Planctomycetota bacterium]